MLGSQYTAYNRVIKYSSLNMEKELVCPIYSAIFTIYPHKADSTTMNLSMNLKQEAHLRMDHSPRY
jgi:hypothetical protein